MLLAAALGYRTFSVLNVPGEPRESEWGLQDFRDAIYFPVRAFIDGENPYDTDQYRRRYPVRQDFPLYSPLSLAIHLPLGLLPYEISELVYFSFTLAESLVLGLLLLRIASIELNWARVFWLGGLILLSRPGHMNIVVGNVAHSAVLLTLAAMHWARSRPRLAGIALAISTFKPTFGIPLFLLMLARRDFRAVAVGAIVGGIASALAMAWIVSQSGGVYEFITVLHDHHLTSANLVGIKSVEDSWARIDAYAVTVYLLGYAPAAWVKFSVCTASFLLAIAVTLFRGQCIKSDGAHGPTAFLFCLTILSCVYHQAYDALLLVAPTVVLASARRQPWDTVTPVGRWICIGLLAIPLSNYVATNTVLEAWQPESLTLAAVRSANGIAILLATLLVVVCCFKTQSGSE